jgi:hypothetical protein
MAPKKRNTALIVAVLTLATSGAAEAQAPIGSRASGMAGAFVGVADDASAVYWNPAGIATGAILSILVDYGQGETAPDDPQTSAGERHRSGFVGLTLPPIGLAYYRLGTYGTGTAEAVVTGPESREEVRRSVHALTTSTVGVSLLHSLNDYVVVSVTPKLVWASPRQGVSADVRAHDALDTAADLDGQSDTVFDVDAGVMMALDHVRVGLVARNLTTPTFAVTPVEFGDVELDHEVRAGVAWGSGWPGNAAFVVAVDGDITTRRTPFGDRRDLAAGVETWWMNRRLGVRGGFRGSTVGDAREAFAAGASAGVSAGTYVEGHVVLGRPEERSWGIGVRMTF